MVGPLSSLIASDQARRGDRISVETHIPCGACYQCGLGEGHNCQDMGLVGISYPGAFAKYEVAVAKLAPPAAADSTDLHSRAAAVWDHDQRLLAFFRASKASPQ